MNHAIPLKTIPGIGKVLALTTLYEIHNVDRFDKVQQFASYARLVKCQASSAGKVKGTSGAKIGNAHLKWAFSEAAVLFLAKCPESPARWSPNEMPVEGPTIGPVEDGVASWDEHPAASRA